MGTVINRISITEATVTQGSGQNFSIYSEWEVAKSSGMYSGSYFMQLIMNANVVAEQEIPNKGWDTDQYGTIQYGSINQNNYYYLQILDATKTVISSQVLLLFSTYEGVKGSYNGTNLHITWNSPQGLLGSGRCTLTSKEEIRDTKTIASNSRHLIFNESLEDFDSNNIWSVVLVPTLNNLVDGPNSSVMNYYTETVTIQSITAKQAGIQEEVVDLTIVFSQPYGNPDGLKLQPVLWKDGVETTTYPAIVMPQVSNNTYTIDISVPKEAIDPYKMEQYQVGIYLCTDNTITNILGSSNICGLANSQIFKRGYYPIINNNTVTGIAYRESSKQETLSQIFFQDELFQIRITQAVVSGVLTLEPQTSGGYLLKIGSQSELLQSDYNAFLSNLAQNNIKISGLYKIQDAIVRGGNLSLIDMLYYHCGLDKNKRSADLRPGFTLEVETASYMPSYEINKLDGAPGFVSSHTAEYRVTTRDYGNDIRLEFNSYIDNFAENIMVASDDNQVLAGGVLDLFVNGYRQPLYKIIYPTDFLSSSQEGTHYQTDNVILIGASTYSQMIDVTNSLSKMVSYEDTLNAPVLLFRGRSAVTLKVSIWLNGNQEQVAIGTTLGKVLERQAIYSSTTATVTMKRVSPMGYVDVQLQTEGNSVQTDLYWRSLPLIHGDRIEVY